MSEGTWRADAAHIRMLRSKHRPQETTELEEIDPQEFTFAEDPAPVAAPAHAPGNPPPNGPNADFSGLRDSLASVVRDVEAWNAANEAAVRAERERADSASRDAQELRDRLAVAERRLADLEGFKKNLKQLLGD